MLRVSVRISVAGDYVHDYLTSTRSLLSTQSVSNWTCNHSPSSFARVTATCTQYDISCTVSGIPPALCNTQSEGLGLVTFVRESEKREVERSVSRCVGSRIGWALNRC